MKRLFILLFLIFFLSTGQPLFAGKNVQTRKEKFALDKAVIPRLPESLKELSVRCVDCHRKITPGIYDDWRRSPHANGKVSCLDCHQTEATASDAFKCSGIARENIFISIVVSPRVCSKCHAKEAAEFEASDHADSWKSLKGFDIFEGSFISPSSSKILKTVGCQQCHGSRVTLGPDNKPLPDGWPNEGIGRINPDGSKGNCSACHTRHKFSLAEARRPESCGSCHRGPDHPQMEIFNESKHGVRFAVEGASWNWDIASGTWQVGDYSAPTCAVCHMSAMSTQATTHNISTRLSWELEKPLAAKTEDWEANRNRMQQICLQCHGPNWIDNFYTQFDDAIELYNNTYFKPAKAMLDELYRTGKLTDNDRFDELIERSYYELWHHEGRRARMGAAMMAQDLVWWEGFYEVAKTFAEITKMYNELLSEPRHQNKGNGVRLK
jgi:hypothetical protein